MEITTALSFDNHRGTPLSMVGPFLDGLEATGVVDFGWFWDEYSAWFHRDLWTPEHSPLAGAIDMDSTHDPFIEAAFGLASNPRMGVRLTTDAIRAAPAELQRKLLSLASATEGRVVLAIGAGELRQTQPFGYKRTEGLARLEDILALLQLLWDRDEPFDYEGRHWTFQQAWLGPHRPDHKPEVWALGGGPKLLELAAKYADGFETAVPMSAPEPERYAELVDGLRRRVEANGRDPEAFGAGVWFMCITHDDPAIVEAALENPLLKYFAGIAGRVDQSQWAAEGLRSVMPEGWDGTVHWMPWEQDAAEAHRIVSEVSVDMVRRSYVCGTPAEISQRARSFIDAGANFVGVVDLLPLVLGFDEATESFRRTVEICSAIKADPS